MTFRTRLFLCFLVVIIVTVIFPGLYVRQEIRDEGIGETVRAVRREAALVRMLLEQDGVNSVAEAQAVLASISTTLDVRVAYLNEHGRVLAESCGTAHPLCLESRTAQAEHAEINAVLGMGIGARVRYSTALRSDVVYVTIPFAGTKSLPVGILRLSVPLERIEGRIEDTSSRWFGILSVATLLALVLAYALSAWMERSFSEMIRVVERIASHPVAEGRRRRLHVLPGREFRRLAHAVNEMADRIEMALHTIEENKAQLETIVNSMAEGVLVLGGQGRIRLVNPAMLRLFPQLGSLEKVEGKHPVEVLPIPALQQSLDQLLSEQGQGRLSLEIETPREEVFTVHLVRPADTSHGVLAVAVFHDVSEMARLMRMRKEFVANVSHELRTPLTAIIGYAETLRDMPPEDAASSQRFTEIIIKNARSMATMVNDLLYLSRIESGAVPITPEPIVLEQALSDALTVCQPLLAARHLHVEQVGEKAIPLLGSRTFLAQVLRNLLENACRYAPEGSVITVRCEVRVNSKAERELLCSVEDQGAGIPKGDLARVFERFYRVEKHRGGTASTGLGLAICKHIVERHGGRIWAESGAGGVLRFTLPLVAIQS